MSFAVEDRVRVKMHGGEGTLLSMYWGMEGTLDRYDPRASTKYPYFVTLDGGDKVSFSFAEIEKVVVLEESAVDMAEFDIEAQQGPDKTKLYLAGPMTGIKDYNFPMFDKVTGILRAAGYEVFNPAENDRENGFDATGLEGHEAHEHGFNLRQALKQDLSWICDHADGIALLPNAGNSKGVKAELALADALGIEFNMWTYYVTEAVAA